MAGGIGSRPRRAAGKLRDDRAARTSVDGQAGAREIEHAASLDFRTAVQQYEAELILGALRATSWNRAETSRRLRIPLRTLSTKISTYGLRRCAAHLS